MKRLLAIISIFAVLLALAACVRVKEDDMERIEVSAESGGRLYCSWEPPESADENTLYRVALICADGKEASSFETAERTCPLIDRVQYYLQNSGGTDITYTVRVRAVNKDGRVFAEGVSDAIILTNVIPGAEVRTVGKDIASEDIISFAYSGSADYLQGNFGYYVYKSLDGAEYEYRYYDDNGERMDGEAILAPEKWNELMALIEGAEVKRVRFGDPDLYMLDGSEQRMSISWDGMRNEDSATELVLSQEAREAVIAWLEAAAVSPEG